jgi:hypothetical protein
MTEISKYNSFYYNTTFDCIKLNFNTWDYFLKRDDVFKIEKDGVKYICFVDKIILGHQSHSRILYARVANKYKLTPRKIIRKII